MRWLMLIGCAALVVASTWFWSSTPRPDPVVRPTVVSAAESKRWVEHLEDGGEVEFRRTLESGSSRVLGATGRLSPADEERLAARIDLTAYARSLAKARSTAESGDPADYHAFLRKRYHCAKVKAAHAMIREGRYVSLPMDSGFPPVTHDIGVFGLPAFSLGDGTRRDIWFLIDLTEFADAREALEKAEEFEAYQLDESVLEFNAKPHPERIALIEVHDAAMRELRNWPKERSAEEAAAVRRRMLPTTFMIDREQALVSKRFRRRH